MDELTDETKNFFEKLSGYDTLRLILCRKAILVEGPSDELIIQKAYRKTNNDRLPIEDEVDVISVGTSFLRFLEIAEKLSKPVAVITDNDKDYVKKVECKYERFSDIQFIEIFYDKRNELYTLEPLLAFENKENIDVLWAILEISKENYPDWKTISKYMINNKTDCALNFFETSEEFNIPEYIINAIDWDYVQE